MLEPLPLRLKSGKRVRGQQFNYTIGDPLGKGGTGIVYQAKCVETAEQVAIKFFLPLFEINLSLFETSASKQKALEDLEELHRKEIACLREVNHPGIVRIIESGGYSPQGSELIPELRIVSRVNFFVMEYVEGPDLSAFVKAGARRDEIIQVLVRISEGLTYLHERKEYLHADLRATNILIRIGSCEPVVIDFALYKNLNFSEVDPNEFTKLNGDWDLFPKNLQTADPLKRLKETSGTRAEIKDRCFPGLDLFQFGKLLIALKDDLVHVFPPADIDFLDVLSAELLDWDRASALSASYLRDQLAKLGSSYLHFLGVEELTPPTAAQQRLQLPGKIITVSNLVDKLTATRSFRRLRSINQLAFIDILYPGAGYRRHLHCLRAYSYCAEMLEALTAAPRFRLLFDPTLARQALALALLHDINHFPLLHIFQEVRGDYLRDVDLFDLFCDGRATKDSPSIYELLAELGLERNQFKDLLLKPHHRLVDEGQSPGLQIVKSLIDSGADVDKLAYLEDDSRFTGVAYGNGIDVGRLLASTTVVEIPGASEASAGWHLAFREEGLPAVESLVMARYWMFRTVYWHRTNRAVMAMLIHVFRKLYVEEKANASEFIIDTMWRPEEAVLEYLNEKFTKRFGADSLTRDLLTNPKSVYHRLFSVQGASADRREAAAYDALSNLTPEDLELCRANLTEKLAEHLRGTLKKGITLGADDILFDIPARRLDTSGSIYISMETGEVKAIEDIPGPIQRVLTDFERLAKRMRVFVHPRVGQEIHPSALLSNRLDILKLIEGSIPAKPVAQVR